MFFHGVQDIWLTVLASVLGLFLFMLVLLVLSGAEAETSDGKIRKLGEGQRRKREGKAIWTPEENKRDNSLSIRYEK